MREKGKMLLNLASVLMVLGPGCVQGAWGMGGDSILLKDIEVLTLYSGKMTTGGRSSPVSQLECIKGGTAGCDVFRPRVVQCYNRGFDGVDVQWECKTDMDNAYRFGEVEVSCEGYSHRDDPYVLRGSCGLRYSLDYTKEGLNQQKGHDYYGSQDSSYSSYGSHQTYGSDKLSKASTFADLIVFVAVALMMYALYKTCVGSSRHTGQDAYSSTADDYPSGGGGGGTGGGYGWFGQSGGNNPTAPPPPGFQPEYTDNASCRNRTAPGAGAGAGAAGTGAAGAGGGGFWTGAAAGGLLGYMFGNRGNQNYGGYHRPRYGGGHHHSSGSSGTRGASGFGGTSRR